MADIASLVISIDAKDGMLQVRQLGSELDRLADRGERARARLRAFLDQNQQSTRAAGQAVHGIGRLNNAFEAMAFSLAGVNPVMGKAAILVGTFGASTALMTGAVAGIAALAFAWDKLTKSARDASKAQDDAYKSAAQAALMKAAGPGGQATLDIGQLSAGIIKLEQERLAVIRNMTSLSENGVGDAFGLRQGKLEEIDDKIEAFKELKRLTEGFRSKAESDANEASLAEFERKKKEAADKAQAARDKEAAAEAETAKLGAAAKLRVQLEELKGIAYVQDVRNKVILDQIEDEKHAAEKRGEQEKLVTENLVREMQDTWSQFFQNIMTEGLRSFRDLFSGIKQLFVKLISDLLAAGVMKRLAGVFGGIAMGSGGGGGQNGGLLNGLGMQIAGQGLAGGLAGGIVGYGVGHMVGGAGGGALAGGLAGAGAGFAVAGPIGALAGGLTGLIGGFLGGAAAAREAAAAMRQMKKDYDAAVLSFKHDDLGQALAQNAADAEALRQAARKLFFTIAQILKDQGQAYQDALADIAATEAKNNEIIKRQAVYAQEDLEVRNLRALGQGDAADRLAFQERQAREMQAALDSNKDALYINTLRTTQNNELLAFLNGTLQDAQRNSPSGFFASAYYQQYATPRDPFGTGMLPPNYPTEPPGTGAAGGSGLNPPGGSRNRPGNLTVNLTVDGKVLTSVVVKNIDQSAAATGGAGSSRSDALNRMPA